MAEKSLVEPQPVFLQTHELGEANRQRGIVTQGTQVAQVVGHPLALKQEGPQPLGSQGHADPKRPLVGKAIGPGVGDGGIA